MTLPELMQALDVAGVRLLGRGDALALDGPEDALTDDVLAAVREHKLAILDALDPPTNRAFGRVHQAALRAYLRDMPTSNVEGRVYVKAPWEQAAQTEVDRDHAA